MAVECKEYCYGNVNSQHCVTKCTETDPNADVYQPGPNGEPPFLQFYGDTWIPITITRGRDSPPPPPGNYTGGSPGTAPTTQPGAGLGRGGGPPVSAPPAPTAGSLPFSGAIVAGVVGSPIGGPSRGPARPSPSRTPRRSPSRRTPSKPLRPWRPPLPKPSQPTPRPPGPAPGRVLPSITPRTLPSKTPKTAPVKSAIKTLAKMARGTVDSLKTLGRALGRGVGGGAPLGPALLPQLLLWWQDIGDETGPDITRQRDVIERNQRDYADIVRHLGEINEPLKYHDPHQQRSNLPTTARATEPTPRSVPLGSGAPLTQSILNAPVPSAVSAEPVSAPANQPKLRIAPSAARKPAPRARPDAIGSPLRRATGGKNSLMSGITGSPTVGNLQPVPDIGPVPKEQTNPCSKQKQKPKKKREDRKVCYKGTYIELRKGLIKHRREEIPCQ